MLAMVRDLPVPMVEVVSWDRPRHRWALPIVRLGITPTCTGIDLVGKLEIKYNQL